jgi:importin-4
VIADGAADETTDSIDLDEIDLEKLSEVNSAIAVEKEIAADTLGVISQATGAHFLPFIEEACLELEKLLAHYYEGIRKSALQSLLEIIQTFYTLSSPQEWVQGTPVVSFLFFSIPII